MLQLNYNFFGSISEGQMINYSIQHFENHNFNIEYV